MGPRTFDLDVCEGINSCKKCIGIGWRSIFQENYHIASCPHPTIKSRTKCPWFQYGKVLWACVTDIQGMGSTMETKAKAIQWAVMTMTGFGLSECNNWIRFQVLIRMIRGEEIWPMLTPIILDITHSLAANSKYVGGVFN